MIQKLKKKSDALITIQKGLGNYLETQVAKKVAEDKLADVEMFMNFVSRFLQDNDETYRLHENRNRYA